MRYGCKIVECERCIDGRSRSSHSTGAPTISNNRTEFGQVPVGDVLKEIMLAVIVNAADVTGVRTRRQGSASEIALSSLGSFKGLRGAPHVFNS